MKPDRAEVAVFAINDSNDIGAANSDTPLLCLPTYVTWLSPACRTVLAFERASKTFRHYDSAPGCSSARCEGMMSGCAG
eukprot:1157822-Pelagomonas_calceolata.AAC.25